MLGYDSPAELTAAVTDIPEQLFAYPSNMQVRQPA